MTNLEEIKKVHSAVNWSNESMAQVFYDQQWKQIWFPEEVAVSKDLLQWQGFDQKSLYTHVFAGLTLLDTVQTKTGMNQIAEYTKDLQQNALYTTFGAFEAIHAKSYSYIFTTLCTKSEIDEIFKWVEANEFLQYKATRISEVYNSIKEDDDESLWKAMFASVMLESFLFYSGFFYPLYLGGQGILKNCAEIIALILRDESIHGVTIGYFAQELLNTMPKEKQDELKVWGYEFMLDLYNNEMKYTDDLYSETGLSSKVKAYVRYNANKALMNLGMDVMFEDEDIDPIVMNGIRTDSVTHDFFSQKGNSYSKSISNAKPITDSTFDMVELMLVRND